MRVDGQVAVVTGAGSGIGRATAIGLAEAGADVVITELPEFLARAEAVATEVRNLGKQALVTPLDVRKVASVDALVEKTLTTFDRVDILVNNAGVSVVRWALDVSEADWDDVLNVNLRGVFFCAQRIGRRMVEQRHGKIVNIASVNGLIGYYKRAPYCSAKAAVVNVTRVLALEWARYGVHVNAVAPVFVRTPMSEKTLDDPDVGEEDIIRRIPLGRPGRPEEIAAAVVFLASPAADMITGQTLAIDGGWTAI
jgi:2-deoxy-D-gluconate 3-dehydrogenase